MNSAGDRARHPGAHRPPSLAVLAVATLVAVLAATGPAAGEMSERAISMSMEYSQLVIATGETAHVEITVQNQGRRDENVYVTVKRAPKGWKAQIRGAASPASRVFVIGGTTRRFTFTAEPEKGVPPGTYTFELEATTADGALTATQDLVVTIGNGRPRSAG